MTPQMMLIGNTGILAVPLALSSTNGPPVLTIGPYYRRNAIRLVARMPAAEIASRLPAPLGFDRATPRFEVLDLIAYTPLPISCTVAFRNIRTRQGNGKISRKAAHTWEPTEQLPMYPGIGVELPLLSPDDWIEIYGESRFYSSKLTCNTLPRPRTRLDYPFSLMLNVRVNWMPTAANVQVVHVNGNPFHQAPVQQPANAHPQGAGSSVATGDFDLDSQILVSPDSSSIFR